MSQTPNDPGDFNNSPDSPGPDQWRQMLESLLGPDGAQEAMRAMEASGMDLSQLSAMAPGGANPEQLAAAMAQMRQVLSTDDDGESDWKIAKDVARQVAHTGGDPSVTSAEAEKAKRAIAAADLWLDVATDLPPAGGQQIAASRADWVERTLPVWQQVADPIGSSVADALANTMGAAGPEMPEGVDPGVAQMFGGVDMGAMVRKLGRLSFAMQVGQSAGTLAREVFGATDTGLPLLRDPAVLLVPANLDEFAKDLDVPTEEVWHFLAVREAAHARLFNHVPWLRSQLLDAVTAYARGIEIDLAQLEDAVRDIDPTDMDQLRDALGGGIFMPQRTPEQERALLRLETLLALIEGWVEEVTAAAVAPHLPHAVPLREMLRRRRAAGGPAEDTLRTLVGLELRPRRARDAASLWALIARANGIGGRDDLWSHPDVLPDEQDLDDPNGFAARREQARTEDADVDDALSKMLSGELGYSEGAREHDEAAESGDSEPAEEPDDGENDDKSEGNNDNEPPKNPR